VEELRLNSARDSSEDMLDSTTAAFLSATTTDDDVINATIYASDAPFLKNSTISLPVGLPAEGGWMPSSETCIYVYIGLILGIIFLIIARVICFFTMCTRASVKLHNLMFSSITRATMTFFNHNPSGEVNATLGCVGHALLLFSNHQSLSYHKSCGTGFRVLLDLKFSQYCKVLC
jgi:ABC-type multidrug transport system fused ATPase/permease subunit